MKFAQYLELKFIEWQHQVGGRKTVLEFATYLGIAQTTASSYMNGKRIPEGETVNKLAEKLGMEIYDSLNLPRPDPKLLSIQQNWGRYSDQERNKIFDFAQNLIDKTVADELQRPPKKRKARSTD